MNTEGARNNTEALRINTEPLRLNTETSLPKHPDISHFGDPEHNEWKQFFIGDDIEPIKGKCPFHHENN
uniref:YqcI/YcgG family protein n=1 Tax=uncultured Allobacillus sp. TaxID=1638025 RepID=UPI0025978CFE|nr:YqcI/YcgG family protein [uncultured Allobacillus sp.]